MHELIQNKLCFYARPHNRTPLMLACAHGNVEVVDLLLNFEDIDLDATDNDGQTAQDIAKSCGWHQVVELLEPFM